MQRAPRLGVGSILLLAVACCLRGNAQPADCKPIEAQWSFTLGCEFIVTEGQLRLFRHADAARRLQPRDCLSHPLIPVEKAGPH